MKQIRRFGVALATLSVLLTLGLALNLSPWLRGDGDWRWDYYPFVFSEKLLLIVLLLTGWIGVALWLARRQRGSVWWAFLGSLLLPFLLHWIRQPDPVSEIMIRTTNPFIGGYFSLGVEYSARDLLQNFPQLSPNWNPHPQRHPPGIILIFAGLEAFFHTVPTLADWVAARLHPYRCEYWPLLQLGNAQFAAASGALLTVLANAVAVFPFATLARRLYPRKSVAYLILLFPLVPAFILFAGNWDNVLILFTLVGVLLIDRALEGDGKLNWLMAGIVFSIGTFLSHAMLVMVGFVGFYALLVLWQRERHLLQLVKRHLTSAITFFFGLATVWLAYWIGMGVSFLEVYRANTAPHFEMESNYLSRLFYNPYDLFLFMGFVIGGWSLYALWWSLRDSQRDSHATAFVQATWLTLFVLVMLGISRAEVGRVWMFLMPLFILCIGIIPHLKARTWRVIYAVTAFQLVVMQVTLIGVEVFDRQYTLPEIAEPVEEMVGEPFELAGWRIDQSTYAAGETLTLLLFWQANAPTTQNFTRFVHLYDVEQGVVAQNDSPPRAGQYPTGCWLEGEVVQETVEVVISAETPPQSYQLLVGMYDPANPNERLQTTAPSPVLNTILLTDQLSISQSDE